MALIYIIFVLLFVLWYVMVARDLRAGRRLAEATERLLNAEQAFFEDVTGDEATWDEYEAALTGADKALEGYSRITGRV